MAALQWSAELALDQPLMDATHEEFVALLQAVQQAGDEALPAAWDTLVAHTADHFAREDAWMAATRFAAGNCHTTHHQMVLDVMRQGLTMGQAGDLAPIRQMAQELAVWFPQHADSMDAALAMHLQRVGFDPATGTMAHADALPSEAIHGCGGVTCTPQDVTDRDAAAA